MKRNTLLILSLILLGTFACSKDSSIEPDPITKANIVGSVNLYDEGTLPMDNAGMTVTIEGSSPQISTTTDQDGKFRLMDVPYGDYSLRYEKEGYGTYRLFNLAHFGGNDFTSISKSPSLGQISMTQVTQLTANVSGTDVIISATTSPAGNTGNRRYIRLFYGTDSDVSSENYSSFSETMLSQINPKDLTITQAKLIDMGFTSGQKVYVKVYGTSFWSNSYDDPNLNRRVFPNLNGTHANAVSFVMP